MKDECVDSEEVNCCEEVDLKALAIEEALEKEPRPKRDFSFDELEEPSRFLMDHLGKVLFRGNDYDKFKTEEDCKNSGRGPFDAGKSAVDGEPSIMLYYSVLTQEEADAGEFQVGPNYACKTPHGKGFMTRQHIPVENFAKKLWEILAVTAHLPGKERFQLMIKYSEKHEPLAAKFMGAWRDLGKVV